MDAPASTAPPLSPKLNVQLSVMMFLQYAIWGAWLPLFFSFANEHRGFPGAQVGYLFSLAAVGALAAPFISGQIADRYFNTEKFLAISHIVGAVMVWFLATIESYMGLVVFGVLYSIIYAPTLALTNSLAFHHLPDRDRDFGKVRVWGTIGWIAVGIGMGQWLLHMHTPDLKVVGELAVRKAQVAGMADSFKLSAILGVVLGVYCLLLPKTPPKQGQQKFAPWEALAEVKKMPLLALFLISFPVACIHQFYFVHTAGFLGKLKSGLADQINTVFGVGGGGLMTIGQIFEIVVLAFMPLVAKKASRKALLTVGLVAYIVRFAVFAYSTNVALIVPTLALHGLCFGCFFFVAFMIVDEETPGNVRASAQGLFNFVVIGLGTIIGNAFAGIVHEIANKNAETYYRTLFSVPMWVGVACLAATLFFYRGGKKSEAHA